MAIIILGKTASGKSRIVDELAKQGYKKIVTTTTRPARKGEIDGVDYNFISEEEFKELINTRYFAEWKKYDTVDGTWYYGSPLDEISRSDNKSIVILTPDGYRDIKDELDEHISIYIYANNKTIRNRLSKRGDKKEEADRRILHDNKDFKGAEELADRIFYNNDGKNIDDLVDEIFEYLKTRGRINKLIRTSGMLMRELGMYPDDFITVRLGEEEYVIDSIGHTKTHGNIDDTSHLCLNVRDGGSGFVRR